MSPDTAERLAATKEKRAIVDAGRALREKSILRLCRMGQKPYQIAKSLGIAGSTVTRVLKEHGHG